VAKKISIFNQKGGVGKSTTTINLGAFISASDKKTLIVDADPQGNSTSGVGIDDDELTEENTIYELLSDKKITREKVLSLIRKTSFDNLYIIPSDITLSDAEIELSGYMKRESILNHILSLIEDDFDYILIDCPPSLGLLSVNSLVASDYLIIPIATSFFSVKGIKHLLKTFNLVKDSLNPKLQIMGILISMYRGRRNIAKNIRSSITEVFGDKVFNTVIRDDVKIEDSQDAQIPILYFNQKCKGYEDFNEFGKEVLTWKEKPEVKES